MVSKIRVLDEHTINKIAAGEVIENPSSVVKELIENSLDAGAEEICIEIKGGGRQLIRITDNGCGMNGDDALLCLERHATSKIRNVEDIHEIFTMGFRGEAIPSIASISKFTLITCPKQEDGKREDLGTMVIVEGGRVIQCCPVSRSPGTTIEVKSLFFNVPVRKKFQKSPVYDTNEILKMISGLALGYPNIKFQLISDQQTLLSTLPPTGNQFHDQLSQRIKDILGSDFADSICRVEYVKDEYSLKGYVGVPAYTRHNRTGQYLFINQRLVSSPLVSFAVRDGFGTTLPSNRHPVFVLHLTLPGTLVDVNVHPQKREVRLRQEFMMKDLIREGINNALHCSSDALLDPFSMPNEINISPSPSFAMFEMPSEEPPAFFSTKKQFVDIPTEKTPFELPALPTNFQASESIKQSYQPTPSKQEEAILPFKASPLSPRVIATIKHYILLDQSPSFPEKREGLCMIDQKSAHSRIIFDKFQKQLKSQSEQIAVQTLLIPYSFDVTPLESVQLLNRLDALNKLGIRMHQAGPNKFLVDAIPSFFGNTDLQSLITTLVHASREDEDTTNFHQERARKVALAAAQASISHNARLSIMEAQALVDQLMQCDQPYQCPLGKQTFLFLSQDELEKRFLKSF